MAASRGRLQTLDISTNGGSTYTAIGKIKDATMTVDSSDINTTTHDSGQWEEFIQGRFTGTMDASCIYDESDAGQVAAIAAAYAQTICNFRFRPKGAASGVSKEYLSAGYVKAAPLDGPNDDAALVKFSIKLTAALTLQTQP